MPFAFLLDGVDELAESTQDNFWKFVRAIVNDFPTAQIIITSRNISVVHLFTGEYRDDIYQSRERFRTAALQWRPPSGFFEFIVSPLTNEEISNFIDRWHTGIDEDLLPFSERSEIKTFPRKLKAEMFLPANRMVLDLSRTPLLCALICMIFFLREGQLPKTSGINQTDDTLSFDRQAVQPEK